LTSITTRRAIGLAAGAVALAAFMSPLAATASAATAPTLTSGFTPNVIGVGGTATLSFTIQDNNSSGTETGIGFTDTLPSGVVIDTPNGESGTCGTNGVVTANQGTNTISLTGGSLKGGAAGSSSSSCLVSVNVTSNTPGDNYSNTAGPVSSSDGTGTSDTQTLTVAGEPTISGLSPANNSTFKYGQKVVVTYSCAEGEFGPGLADGGCSASDENGNTIASGGTLDTNVVGRGQQVEVDAISSDDLQATAFINYTVLPNNAFTVVKTSAGKNGTVTLKLKVPGAGKLAVGEKVNGKSFSSYSGKANGAKTVTITLTPSSAGATLLKKLAKEKHPPKLTGKLSIAYTPTGGKKKTATVGGIKLKS
jgi:hypothetical protein